MKTRRKVDELGRLVIPINLRESIGVKNNSDVDIELIGNSIVITNSEENDRIERIKNKLEDVKKNYEIATDKEFYFGYMKALEWLLEESELNN